MDSRVPEYEKLMVIGAMTRVCGDMKELARLLEKYNERHAAEMRGAAGILETWIKEMKNEM